MTRQIAPHMTPPEQRNNTYNFVKLKQNINLGQSVLDNLNRQIKNFAIKSLHKLKVY